MDDFGLWGPFDLVVFDCDGVLVDSERLAVPLETALLNELGWAITEEEVARRFLGRSVAECRKDLEEHFGGPLAPEISAESDRRYEEALRNGLEAVPGVVAALDALQVAGVATCVASSSTHARLELTLGVTGLLDRFEGRIFSAEDVERGKPAPDLFLHAAAALGCAPSRCAVVEDSPYGIEAALVAGMTPFAYGGGVVPCRQLQAPGAVCFEDMSQLVGLLLGEPGDSDADALREQLPVVGGIAENQLG